MSAPPPLYTAPHDSEPAEPPPETCDECGGSGRVRWTHRDCPVCSGDGVLS